MYATGCSSDSDEPEIPSPTIKDVKIDEPEGGLSVTRCHVLPITATVTNLENVSYEWGIADSVISTEKELSFISLNPGTFDLHVKIRSGNKEAADTVRITVTPEVKPYSEHISEVFDFMPAPGQYGNSMPEYKNGDTQASMNTKVKEAIGNGKGMISLGAYGGYVVVGFDHTIVNMPDSSDFKVLGNAFYSESNPKPGTLKGGSCEPGIVLVAYDKNKNGKPDEDEWYELAGSEYKKPSTIKNYEITYYKPDKNKVPTPNMSISATDTTYVRWTDNKGGSGYIFKNSFHGQDYYPAWAGNQITFKGGTLLPNNGIDESGAGTYYVLYAFDWGYADNHPNNSSLSNLDIDWAIDKNGNKVNLPGIDFVKIYTGVQQYAGWLGDTSTEICGVIDLHLQK